MAYFPTWSTCNGLPGGSASSWSDIGGHLSPITWTCYAFGSKALGMSMNNAIAIGLIIAKCNDLQAQVDAGGGGEVTMAAILSEMMAASFEELTSFMGITQAYKVAVWDAPFNEEFYAALAREFKTWGA